MDEVTTEHFELLVRDLRKLRLTDDEDLENSGDRLAKVKNRTLLPITIRGEIPGEEVETKPPQSDDPFPGCPFVSDYDNSIQRILAHSCRTRAKFCVVFKFFRSFGWVDAEVIVKLVPKVLLSEYLTLLEKTNLLRYRELLVKAPAMMKVSGNQNSQETLRMSPHLHFFQHLEPVFSLKTKPFYGCPGNSLKDNEMLCILEHGYYNRKVKFCVAFRNYGFWNWIEAFIVWRLKPRYVLKEYLKRLREENEFRYNVLIHKIVDSEELKDDHWKEYVDDNT